MKMMTDERRCRQEVAKRGNVKDLREKDFDSK